MKYLLSLSFAFIVSSVFTQVPNYFLKYLFNSNCSDESINSIDATGTSVNYVNSYQVSSLTAVNFNGTNAFASITTNNTIKRPFPISIAFWINFTNDGEEKTVFKTDVNSSNDYGFWVKITTTNTVQMGFGDGGTSGFSSQKTKTSANSLTENSWQHVVCIFRSTYDMDIFIDCQNAGGSYSGSGANSIQYNSFSSLIGKDYVSGTSTLVFSAFKLDELTLFSRELASNEINLFCDPSSEINENTINQRFIYPNPAKNSFSIKQISAQNVDIELRDLSGKRVKLFTNVAAFQEISLTDISSGVYLVSIHLENGKEHLERLMIE